MVHHKADSARACVPAHTQVEAVLICDLWTAHISLFYFLIINTFAVKELKM